MSKTEWNFEPFAFTSEFDSGNLARVEFRSRDTGGEQDRFEFDVWTAPDCAESECENSNRTWFYFAVVGQQLTNKTLRINVRNLNRQTRLYQQGMAPFVRTVPGRVKWERIKERPLFEVVCVIHLPCGAVNVHFYSNKPLKWKGIGQINRHTCRQFKLSKLKLPLTWITKMAVQDFSSVCLSLSVCQYIYSHISELLHSKQIYQFEKGQITRKIN